MARTPIRLLGPLVSLGCFAVAAPSDGTAQVSNDRIPLSGAYTTATVGLLSPMGVGLTLGRLYPRGDFGRIMPRIELAGGLLLDKGRETADFYGGPLLFLGYAFRQSWIEPGDEVVDPYVGLTTGVHAAYGGLVGVAGVALGLRAIPRLGQREPSCRSRQLGSFELQLQYWSGNWPPQPQVRIGFDFPAGC
jgi:hypothetical protein